MTRFVFISLMALSSTAALAQTAPATGQAPAAATAAPTVGATVTGKDNQPAGTIVQVTAQAVVIDTGTNKVPVPPTSIGTSPKGPTIGMTKAELDAAFADAAAKAQASVGSLLTPGRMVHGLNGAMLGTIKSSTPQGVVVTTPKGEVQLPSSAFAPGANGTVTVGVTAEQLDAALAKSGAPAPATQPDATTQPAATPDAAATTDATKPKPKPKK